MNRRLTVRKKDPTFLQHMCQLDFTKDTTHRRMTSIIATIGPKSRNVETIYQMIKAGANIIRLNFLFEDIKDHVLSLEYIHAAVKRYSKELGYIYPLGIAGELKGRVIRTGSFQSGKFIELKAGDLLRLSVNEYMSERCTKEAIYIDYPGLLADIQEGQRIYLDDNTIELEVREIEFDMVVCQVTQGGKLNNHVTVAVPGIAIKTPPVTEKDKQFIEFCIKNNFDFLFASKLRTADDINELREALGNRGKRIKIITKMDNTLALTNMDEILNASDGICIPRAEMCAEFKLEKIFTIQKIITGRCNILGKPVICGTQFLLSMRKSIVPQRMELADIATALLDGADCLFVSSETAVGNYPIEVIKVLENTCRETEAAILHHKLFEQLTAKTTAATDGAHAIAISAVSSSISVKAKAIVVVTVSGRSAQLVSMYRPNCVVLAVTRNPCVARQLTLYRGIIPIVVPAQYLESKDIRVDYALTIANTLGIVKSGDTIVVVSQWKQSCGITNNINVVYAKFDKDSDDCLKEQAKRFVQENASLKKVLRILS